MNIYVKLFPSDEVETLSVSEGVILEEIASQYEKEFPFKVYAANVNGKIMDFMYQPVDGDVITFLSLKEGYAKEFYQNSVIAMFAEALKRTFPGLSPVISNSLNKGLYCRIKQGRVLTQEEIDQVEKCMRGMTKENIALADIDPVITPTVPFAGRIRNYDLKAFNDGIIIRTAQDTSPNSLISYKEDNKLANAFSIKRRWNDMLGLNTAEDLNKVIRSGEIADIIRISEALHEKDIANLADDIIKQGKRIVLIAGPSSSGKTSFAKRLCTQIWVNGQKPIYLGTDDYFLDRELIPFGPDGKQNFEDLDAIDVELFNKQMNQLLSGEPADIPRFDFISGKQVFGENIITAKPGQIIVIEGIHALNDALTPQISAEDKYRIYISPLSTLQIDDYRRIPLTDIRKIRRIVRDAKKRGWDATHTIESWASVRAGEEKNIFPYSDNADAVFNSSLVYELAALKKWAEPMLADIPEGSKSYIESRRLLELLNRFEELPDENVIANNSLIREFIGGSTIA